MTLIAKRFLTVVTVLMLTMMTLAVMMLAAGCAAQEPGRVFINQVGHLPAQQKYAAVAGVADSLFAVVDTATGDTVHTDRLSDEQFWSLAGSNTRLADISCITSPGSYELIVDGGSVRAEFSVDSAAHHDLTLAVLKAYYYQRASTALEEEFAGRWHRVAGHPDTSVAVHSSAAMPWLQEGTILSAPRGWYDAGDYNKYVVNSGISTYQLLAAYEHHPEFVRSLNVGIPESGGSLPDVLAEVRWNLDWMLAMQDPIDGGVFHKLTTASFEGAVMPHAATSQRYVVRKSTTAALNFAAVMAQAGRIFRAYDATLADSMVSGAVRAWHWARLHPEQLYRQNAMNAEFSPDIVTGAYGDNNASDEFAWAATELYLTTGADSLLPMVETLFEVPLSVPSWSNVRALGVYSLARADDAPAALTDQARRATISLADTLSEAQRSSTFRTTMGTHERDFVWGSNGHAANQAMLLMQAYDFTGEAAYREAALGTLDYLLGRNPTGYSFVTGFGSRPAMHPHHRPSRADGIEDPVPGFLVGGPNPGRQDGTDCAEDGVSYPSTRPAMAYVDDWCSWASNEVTINWNAPLAYSLVALGALADNEPASTGDCPVSW